MARLPVLKPKEVIRILERAGFSFERSRGSHRIYVMGDRIVTIAFHNRDMKRGTLARIIKDSGLTSAEVS